MKLIRAAELFRLALVAVLMASTVSAGVAWPLAADDGEANRLFVEAVRDIGEADQRPDERADDQAANYERALRNIERIIAEHPGSDVAVKLIAGEPIGDITQWRVERRAIRARAMACLSRWDAICILREAEAAARHAGVIDDDAWFNQLRALVYAERGLYQAARAAANDIEEGAARAWVLGDVAGKFAAIGARENAVQLLEEAEGALRLAADRIRRGNAYAAVGWAYAKLGDAEAAKMSWREAHSTLDALSDQNHQIYNRYRLAWYKIDAGAVADALPDIEWLSKPLAHHFLEARAHAFAVQLYALADRPSEANEVLADLEAKLSKYELLRLDQWLMIWVAAAYASAGRSADALITADQIDTARDRSLAYSWISAYWNFSQHKDAILSALRKALRSAEAEEQPGPLSELIASVAEQVARR